MLSHTHTARGGRYRLQLGPCLQAPAPTSSAPDSRVAFSAQQTATFIDNSTDQFLDEASLSADKDEHVSEAETDRSGALAGWPLSVYRFVPVESWVWELLVLGSELLVSARERHQSTGNLILESNALSFQGNPWGSCNYYHTAFAKIHFLITAPS